MKNILKRKEIKNCNVQRSFLYRFIRRPYYNNEFDFSKDYYKILGVSSNSTDKEIKAAYHKLARKYHPDLNQGKTTDAFKEASNAYDILSNPDKRKKYDMYIKANSFHPFSQSNETQYRSHQKDPRGQSSYSQNQDKFYTTYTFRDGRTGEFRQYKFTGGNPFMKDFEEIFKDINNRRDQFYRNQSNSNFEGNFGDNQRKYDAYRNFRARQNNEDIYSNFRQNQQDYSYSQGFNYDYNYRRDVVKIFKWMFLGSLFIFLYSNMIARRRAQYYSDLNYDDIYRNNTQHISNPNNSRLMYYRSDRSHPGRTEYHYSNPSISADKRAYMKDDVPPYK